MDREAWTLLSFAALFVAAMTVSVCGWILLWRDHKRRRALEDQL